MPQGVSTAPKIPGCNIGEIFDRIATRYDLLNHLLSLGRDIAWRRRVVGRLEAERSLKVVDLATGTGDLLIAMLRDRPNTTEAVGLDLSPKMLEVCRKKLRQRGLTARTRLLCEDVSATSFPENTFHAATMAFGIRNTPDVPRTLQEMRRILRPGGAALILEFSWPKSAFVRAGYLAYLRWGVPLIGRLISGNEQAYRYLSTSIEGFHRPRELCRLMKQAGFIEVAATPLTWGVASIYTGRKAQ